MGYHWNCLYEPVFMAGPKPMRTEFGIHPRLESSPQEGEPEWVLFCVCNFWKPPRSKRVNVIKRKLKAAYLLMMCLVFIDGSPQRLSPKIFGSTPKLAPISLLLMLEERTTFQRRSTFNIHLSEKSQKKIAVWKMEFWQFYQGNRDYFSSNKTDFDGKSPSFALLHLF